MSFFNEKTAFNRGFFCPDKIFFVEKELPLSVKKGGALTGAIARFAKQHHAVFKKIMSF
ncbi:hypothetical protein ACFQAT_01890 [Undibacterium arcticum]|uniref:hypothetical protein n=1 Tax=Undibacterium arcticum TaxID=1762892 RepID=UPI00361EAA3E